MLALLVLAAPAHAWPAAEAWVALTRSDDPITDPTDDHVHGDSAHGSVDLVGDETEFAAYWYVDATDLYLRLKVDDDPWISTGVSFRSSAWGFLLDTDANPADWEYALTLNGPLGGVVSLYSNATGADGVAVAGTFEGAWPALDDDMATVSESAVLTSGDPDFFVDLRIPREDLDALTGSAFSGTFSVAAVTEASASPSPMDNDVAGNDDSAGIGALTDGASDPIAIDQDGDGLTDLEEADLGLDPTDADSDDDGLTDGEELARGTDPMDCDSDGDGLHDGLEMSLDAAGPDTDVGAGCFAPDRDEASTDPLLADTDGGGLLDGTEDRNADGEIDAFETDPNDPSDDVDSDGDLIPDAIEEECGGDDPDNRDGDDRSDAEEGLGDTDGDGIPDFCDEDDDGDGMNSIDEGIGDSDGDGIPDDRDTDSDNDGIPDGEEGLTDADCDGFPDYRDNDDSDGPCADPDGDGLTNDEEAACATDPNDPDTDHDGIGDAEESCTNDEDCDQLPDAIDATDDDRCGEIPPGDDTGGDCSDEPFGACGDYVGGACGTVSTGAALAGTALAAAAALGRRRRAWLLALTTPAAAHAGTNAQRFVPTDGERFLAIEDSALAGNGVAGGLVVNHAQAPLVYRFDDERLGERTIVGSVQTLDLFAAYSWKPVRLAVDMPFHLSEGDYTGGGAALGDLRVSAKASVLDRARAPLGLAVLADLSLPTGATDDFLGSGAPVYGGGLSAAVGRSWVAAANLGVRGSSPAQLGDLSWGTRLSWGLGGSVPVTDALSVIAEVDGELALDSLDAAGAAPAEWRVGAAWRPWKDLVVRAGGGTGLTTGLGAPEWRAIAGVAWVPPMASKVDAAAAPPRVEAVSPVAATEPPHGWVVIEVRNEAGQPLAALVTVLGAGVKFTTTGEGLGEQQVAPGTVELSAWSEGYRPERVKLDVAEGARAAARLTLQPSRVVVLPNQVQVRDKIFFEFDSAIIKADSFRILDDLAATLENHPEVGIVEVQGHTDDQGTEEYNLRLSQERAEAVRAYLVQAGIPADRLLARGYGESLPLQPGQSEEAREANRRVMFVILR